jgi:hypothetical protein
LPILENGNVDLIHPKDRVFTHCLTDKADGGDLMREWKAGRLELPKVISNLDACSNGTSFELGGQAVAFDSCKRQAVPPNLAPDETLNP